jgi:hypothetical protein
MAGIVRKQRAWRNREPLRHTRYSIPVAQSMIRKSGYRSSEKINRLCDEAIQSSLGSYGLLRLRSQ